ncbi:DUF485 domain-containing protein [Kitasatospora viridis]|uniref:Uncharacterized membrane protein (DUF485 family) n=1 Tax=Kitasatospora viridis TaxID=281105 RepID=A0A561UDY6_9ACTN|nr:DUF485 domain-containing protein [Kitasatospora viridis]TWF97582.1 uncharacterized membrane protein (DUF485 family) [Kitasatospora viridis]
MPDQSAAEGRAAAASSSALSAHSALPEPVQEAEHEFLSAGRPSAGGSTARSGPLPGAARSARSVLAGATASAALPAQRPAAPAAGAGLLEEPDRNPAAAEVYREVQQSQAFQEIRGAYRRFVFPATAVFLGWYLFYVTAQAAAPDLMRTQLAGPFSVAWLLGLLQFVSTFVITWLYSRNAHTKRDRAALGLRWDTQDQLR